LSVQRIPRRRARALRLIILVAILAGVSAGAQEPNSAASAMAFDVSSVKRFQAAQGRFASDAVRLMPGGRFTAAGATLPTLIATAYGVLEIQVVANGLIDADARYEIDARTKSDVTAGEARAMLRTLLSDRFALRAHRETRELPVYVLTVARADRRLGAQFRPSAAECAPIQGPPNVPAPPPPPPPPGETTVRGLVLNGGSFKCLSVRMSTTNGEHWSYRDLTMPVLVQRFVSQLGRPVVDRTNLEGPFDLDLTYASDNPVVDASGAPNAPSFATAVREQLGLRLEPDRAPVDVIVIDRIGPPTEN
jgi:uncharacterized protein (TIGR03435 family)